MEFGSVGGSSDGGGRRVIPDAGVVVGENGFPIQGRRPWDPVTPSKTEQPVGRDARPQWVQPAGIPRNGSLQDIAPQKEASRRAVNSSSGGSSLWLDSGIYMAPMQHCPNGGGASGAQAPVSGPSTNMQGLRIASSEQNKQSQMRLLALMDPASNALWFHPVQQQYASAPILLPTNQNLSRSNGTKITSYRLPCDLNSPANTIADPDSNGSIIFQMAPVTPDRGGRIQNGQSTANPEKHENSLPPRPLLHCKDPIQVSGDQDHSQLFDSLAPIYFTPVQESHGLSQPFYSSPTAVPMLLKAKGLSRQSDSSPAVHSTQVKAIRRPSQQPFNSSASLTSTSANGNQGWSQPPNSLPSLSFNTLVKGNQGVSTSANGNQGLSQPPDSLPSISSNTLVKENQGVSQPLGSPSAILSTHVMESQSLSHHGDSSPAFDSTPVKEKGNLRKGEKEIDLNKTPPQKLPRRKKHRPKVIKERKSKKTPKPNTPKQAANKDNPSGKRKYVRKTGPKVASTPPSADNGETINLDTREGKKPCRRALNFESEILAENKHTSTRNVQHDRPNSSIVNGFPNGEACSIPNFNFGAESQIRDGCAGFSSSTGYKSTLQLGKGLEVVVENSSLGIAFDLNHSLTQMLDEYISLPENPSPPLARKEPQQENTDVIPGKQNEVERVGGCINGGQNVNIPIHLHASEVNHSPSNQYFHSEAPIQIRNPVETYHQDHKSNSLSRLQNGIQSVNESQHHSDIRAPVEAVESNHMKTGFKRVYNQMANDTQLSKKSDVRTHAYQKIIHEKYSDSSCNHGMYGIPNIYERTNMSCNKPMSGASHPTTMPIDGINGAKSAIRCDMNGVIASPVAVQNSDKWPSPSNFMEVKRNAKNRSNNTEFRIESQTMNEQRYHMVQNSSGGAIMSLDGQMGINHNQQQVPDSMSVHGPIERRIKKKWNGSFQVRTLPLLNVAPQHYQLQTIPRTAKTSDNRQAHNTLHGTLTCAEALAGNQAKVKTKRRTKKARAPPSNPLLCSRTNQAHLQAQGTAPYDYRQLSAGTKKSMQAIMPYNNVIDEITYRLQCLNINWDSKISTAQAQNALVPYIGERMMIPYNGQLPLPKKRRPRAKVELDDETNRVWKLLMWKEGSDGSERTDAENGKLWEEQRRIFQGRADSFIARMRLVQGDRRFSPWKGSVVDSVVGVFLTQNVSDHLSSSAFMALAARFPRRSRSKNDTANGEGRSTPTEASEYTSEIDDTIKWHSKISAQQACDQRSVHRAEPMDEKEVANCNESFGSNVGGGTNNLKGESNISYVTGPEMFHESPENRTDTPGAVTESASFVVTGPEMCQESPENRRYTQVAVTERACFVDADCKVQDDVVSSQASVVSSQNSTDSTLQAADRVGSSSESNSEAENQLTEFTCNQFSLPTSFMELLGMAELFPCLSSMGNGNILYKENYEGASGQLEGTKYDITRSGFDEKDLPSTDGVHQQEQHPMERNESITGIGNVDHIANFLQEAGEARSQSHITNSPGSGDTVEVLSHSQNSRMHQNHAHLPNYLGDNLDVAECSSFANKEKPIKSKVAESNSKDDGYSSKIASARATNTPKAKRRRSEPEKKQDFDWDSLRKQACCNGQKKERTSNRMDSVDWEAVRLAEVGEIAHTIRERGMNNMLAERIKDFLNRVVKDHGSIDLEWLRDIPPEKAKEYLLSVRGLGLKSVECVRLLTLHHLAFPVDTNVGRICVRLGWVPIEPLPESVQLHLLELYPLLENIQRYLWPRLCTLDQRTLYELHYQMITFGKVFCTKSKPNCNACPMRAECRHFASAFASARLALPGPEEKSLVSATVPITSEGDPKVIVSPLPLPPLEENPHLQVGSGNKTIEPIIEEPATPEPEHKEVTEADIEDAFWEEDPEEIPTIKLNIEELSMNVQNFIQEHNMDLEDFDMSKALVALTPEAASIPMPKLKNVSRLRTEHQVYELPDSHPLLKELDKREPDDPCSYLLAIWTPGETAQSTEPPEICCATQPGNLCDKETCFSCNSLREANAQTVRGTLLIPCRTAMRGSFPLNGTYFQVNEVFADHESSIQPMDVPRSWLWNLPRRTVYFGTSIPTIFKGLSTEGIQHCFWRGFVCVRGFDQKTRAPRPLMARLHFPASKIVRNKKTPTKSE